MVEFEEVESVVNRTTAWIVSALEIMRACWISFHGWIESAGGGSA